MQIIHVIKQVLLPSLVVFFLHGCSENEMENSFENVEITLKHNEIFKDTIETFIDLGGIWLTSYEGLDSIDRSNIVTCLDGNINRGKIINDYTTSDFISLVKEGKYSECFICSDTIEIKLKSNKDTNVLCTYVVVQTGEKKIKHRDFDVLKSDAAGYPIFTEWIETVPVYGDSIINEYVGFYNKDSSLLRLVDYKRSDVIYFKLLDANYRGSFTGILYEPKDSYLSVKIEDSLLTDSINIITYNPLRYYDSLKSAYNIFSPYQNSFKDKYKKINKFFESRNLKYELESEKIEMIEKLGFYSFFNESELSFKWGLSNIEYKDFLYHLIKNTKFEMQEHNNDINVFGYKTRKILKNNFDWNYNREYTYSDAGESIIKKIENLIFENFIKNARLKNINLSNFTGEYSFFLSFVMDKGEYETKYIPIILNQEKYISEFYNILEILLSNTEFDQSAARTLKNFILPIKIDLKLPFNYSRISKSHPKNFDQCCSLKPDSNFYLEISNNGTKNNFYQLNPVKNILSFEKFIFLEEQMNINSNAVNKSTITYNPQGMSASVKGMPCENDGEIYYVVDKNPRPKNLTKESLIKKIKKILVENPIPHISSSKKIDGRLHLIFNIDCNGTATIYKCTFSDVITDYFILKALRENLKIEWEPAEYRGNLVNSSFDLVIKNVAY